MSNPNPHEGETLNNRYRLLAVQVGSGGMAHVYKAEDLALGRVVAVKILRDNLTADPEFLARFQREARSAANLSHPNVVTVHDVGQDRTRYYIVMEYVEGQDLKEVIRKEAPFAIERALDLAVQICAGVGYAHRAGIIHCDVKPQNVLVTPDGRAKVTDFGIARALSSATVPLADTVWGTPHYFAPEQAAGKPPSPAADVYAIGVILYEMLTGKLPFEADSYTALALKHMHEEPPRLAQFNPQIPEQLENIVLKVLSKEPSARYRSAEQFGRILIGYRREALISTGSRPPVAPEAAPPTVARPPASPPPAPRPAAAPARPAPVRAAPPAVVEIEDDEQGREGEIDWLGIILGALALIAILGLFPLWAVVYRTYLTQNTPAPAPAPGVQVLPWYAQAGSLPVVWDR
jgi:serine/threonine-protein kinase